MTFKPDLSKAILPLEAVLGTGLVENGIQSPEDAKLIGDFIASLVASVTENVVTHSEETTQQTDYYPWRPTTLADLPLVYRNPGMRFFSGSLPILLGLEKGSDSLESVWRTTQGKLGIFSMAPFNARLVCHPVIGDILGGHDGDFDRGDEVKKQRMFLGKNLLTDPQDDPEWEKSSARFKAFMGPQMKGIGLEALKYEAANHVGLLRDKVGGTVDVADFTRTFAYSVVSRMAFGERADLAKPHKEAWKVIDKLGAEFLLNPFAPPSKMYIKLAYPELAKALEEAQALIREGYETQDVGGYMVKLKQYRHENGLLSLDEIEGEMMTFYFAGHDTSATLMKWALLVLGENTEWREKIYEEIYNFQQSGGGLHNLGKLEEALPCTTAAINEILRMRPPVPGLTRRSRKREKGENPIILGGIEIPHDCMMFLSIMSIHNSPEIWEKPEQFDPTRFMPGHTLTELQKASYMPFGVKPNICPGRFLAKLKLYALLFALVEQKKSFNIIANSSANFKPHAAITLGTVDQVCPMGLSEWKPPKSAA